MASLSDRGLSKSLAKQFASTSSIYSSEDRHWARGALAHSHGGVEHTSFYGSEVVLRPKSHDSDLSEGLLLNSEHHRIKRGPLAKALAKLNPTLLFALWQGVRKQFRKMLGLACCATDRRWSSVSFRTEHIDVVGRLGERCCENIEAHFADAKIATEWVPECSEESAASNVTLVFHQPEERLCVAPLRRALADLNVPREQLVLVLLLPHNPDLVNVVPLNGEDRTSHTSFQELLSVACMSVDLYFWAGSMDDKRLKARNQAALDQLLGMVLDTQLVRSPRKSRLVKSGALPSGALGSEGSAPKQLQSHDLDSCVEGRHKDPFQGTSPQGSAAWTERTA